MTKAARATKYPMLDPAIRAVPSESRVDADGKPVAVSADPLMDEAALEQAMKGCDK